MVAGDLFFRTPDADARSGTAGDDSLYRGAGDDTLVASGGFTETFIEEGTDPETGERIQYDAGFQVMAMSTLNGGAGDDVFITRNGAEMTGGEGSDTFALSHATGLSEIDLRFDTLEEFPPSIITDSTPGEDVIAINPAANNTGALGLEAVTIAPWADGSGAEISVNGYVVAQVTGGAGPAG